ncbi:hypothetical protein V8C44DRAFT_31239 [Trichoderma aethiopicum]
MRPCRRPWLCSEIQAGWDASGSRSGWLCLSLYVFSCAYACVSLASLPPSLSLLCFSLLLFLSFLTHTEKQTVTGGPSSSSSSRSRRIMHAASPVVPLRSRGLPQRNAQLKPPKPHMSLFAKPVTAKPEKAPPPESRSENVRPKHGCQSQKGKIRHQSDTSPPVMPCLCPRHTDCPASLLHSLASPAAGGPAQRKPVRPRDD